MSVHSPFTRRSLKALTREAGLSEEELAALEQACLPVGLLQFPSVAIIRTLRQRGYVQIVLGGVQITHHGLERLLLERNHKRNSSQGVA